MSPAEWTTILGRYGEIGVKSHSTRVRFVDVLLENLTEALDREGIQHTIERERGRFYVHTPDPEAALDVLTRTFGVVSASPVTEVAPTVEAVAEAAAERGDAILEPGETFAIRSRRAGDHDFDSMDVAREAGDRVLEAVPEAEVDLDDPDHEIHTEVRPERAFVFTRFVDGPGGLPRGTQGAVVALVEAPRDALAAWTLRRRGCTVVAVAPDPLPDDLEAALEALARWAPVALVTVPLDEADPAARRARLLAAAEDVADEVDAKAVATGDRLEEAIAWTPLDALVPLPVFRPLVGLDRDALQALARTVGLEDGTLAGPPQPDGEASPPGTLPEADVDEAGRREVTP